jgi:hypothetical protein
MTLENWIPPEDYSEKEQHEDWAWDMAEGYMTACVKCHRPVMIVDFGPSRSLICETCEPNDDE